MDRRAKTPVSGEQHARSLLDAQLAQIYTPDVPIVDPSLFSGRGRLVDRCRRLLATPGATLVITGERGIGKTSLCNVMLHDQYTLRRNATSGTTPEELFVSILTEIGQHLSVSERGTKGTAGFSAGLKADAELSEKRVPLAAEVFDVNVLIARLGKSKLDVRAIVIDEIQEIQATGAAEGRLELASLSKAWADARVSPLLVFIGVAGELNAVADQLQQYGGRNVHEIAVSRLTPDEARDIIMRRERLGVRVSDDAATRAVELADGFPWLLQRLMLTAIYAWIDRHPGSAIALPESSRLRFRAKRVAPVVNLEALNILIEHEDVEQAMREVVMDVCRNDVVAAATAVQQLSGPGDGRGVTLPELLRRHRPTPRVPATPSAEPLGGVNAAAPKVLHVTGRVSAEAQREMNEAADLDDLAAEAAREMSEAADLDDPPPPRERIGLDDWRRLAQACARRASDGSAAGDFRGLMISGNAVSVQAMRLWVPLGRH